MMPHAASGSRCSGFPDWVLLDTVAHMGRCRDNATTAVAQTSAGCDIEVSFVVADPPALTRCIVDCPHLTRSHFLEDPPYITGVDGAFLLLSVSFPEHSDRSDSIDLFIYKPGPGIPSLELLPRPYPLGSVSYHVGVLSCGDHCLVVIPELLFDKDPDGRMRYRLHIFSSKTKSWSAKIARLPSGMYPYGGPFHFSKVFALGGGSMAWVDLQNSILVCDAVAGDDPKARLIQLPPLIPINVNLEMGFDGGLPCMDTLRDVAFKDGCFRFIEMGFLRLHMGANSSGKWNFRWKVAMFKRKIHSDDEWEPCGTADSAELTPSDSCLSDLFPAIWDKKLTLNNVLSQFPTLDMYNNDMIYMMAKMKATDPSGWMIAVNTKKKKLERIATFSEESLHLHRIYRQCDFSYHISKAPGTCFTKDLGRCTNRQKIEYLDNNLLAALDLLRNIETNVESLNRRYNRSISLFLPTSASSIDPEVETEAEYGLNNGRGTNAISEHFR